MSTADQKQQPPKPVRTVSRRACLNCRERKIKCDGVEVCRNCKQLGLKCVFVKSHRGGRRNRIKPPAQEQPPEVLGQSQQPQQPDQQQSSPRQSPPQQQQNQTQQQQNYKFHYNHPPTSFEAIASPGLLQPTFTTFDSKAATSSTDATATGLPNISPFQVLHPPLGSSSSPLVADNNNNNNNNDSYNNNNSHNSNDPSLASYGFAQPLPQRQEQQLPPQDPFLLTTSVDHQIQPPLKRLKLESDNEASKQAIIHGKYHHNPTYFSISIFF
jgi:hypothetical protein